MIISKYRHIKHQYVTPQVQFEEMDGDALAIASGNVTGSNGVSGDPLEPGKDPNGDIEEAKSSTFIWEEEPDFNLDF